MNWWFTPISFILTLVIYIAPPIILRFAVFRKPIEHKKARNFSLIYGAVFLIILAFVSKEMAILQALFIIPWFGFVNYFLLAGFKENPHGQIFLLRSFWFLLYGFLSSGISLILSIHPASTEKATLVLDFIFHLPFLFLFLYKYTKVKKDIKAKFEQKEKLGKENIESKTEE